MKFANAVEFWGPCAWKFLHSVAATYDPTTAQIGMDSLVEYKRPYITFFGSIGDILPCKLCRQHFKSYAATNPLGESMGSTETMQRWVYNAHNQVNVSNNKISPPFHEVQRRYGELEQTKPGGGLHTRESLANPFFGAVEPATAIASSPKWDKTILFGVGAMVACGVGGYFAVHMTMKRTHKRPSIAYARGARLE
jgi:hypothetical protein